MQWLERRLPIASLVYSSFIAYPTPRNLNYWWTFGGILTFMLGVQIITGIVLAMHYTPHVDFAFNSVEGIMRDVNYGWLLRYVHANGASFFFLAVYIHMARGMYYGSYKEPREVLWILGVILFLLMVATGFMGYVLPWGQMSFWAATVITNLFSALPRRRRSDRHLALGRLCGRQSDAQSLLLAALPVAVRHRRRGRAARLGAAHGRAEQSDRRRGQGARRTRSRSRPTRRSRTRSSSACSASSMRGSCSTSRTISAIPTITSWPIRARRRPISCRNGITCRSTRSCAPSRTSSLGVMRARRRHRRAGLPAVARYVAGALGELPAALPAIPVHLLRRRDRAWLSRLAGARPAVT